MDKDILRKITIETQSKEECERIGSLIHEQLRGNKDYIESNIILNCKTEDNVVELYICKYCEKVPVITI